MAPGSERLLNARQCVAEGRFVEAERSCRDYLREHPQHVAALDLLGQAQFHQGNYAAAIESVRTAIGQLPDDAGLHRNLGIVHWALGDVDHAIACYRHASQLDPADVQTISNLAMALNAKGMLDDAIDVLQAFLSQHDERASVHRDLAEMLYCQGRWHEAAQHFHDAVRLSPGDATLHNGLGVVLTTLGNHSEAISQYEEALRLQPEYAEAAGNLAMVLCRADRPDEAVAHGEDAIRLQPQRAEPYVSLGLAFKSLGRIEEALSQYEQALQFDPRHADAHNQLGSALVDVGRFDDAVMHFQEALRCDPNFAPAYQSLGELAQQNKYQFSSQQLRRMEAIVSDQRMPPEAASSLHFTLAGVFEQRGDVDVAFRSYQTANRIKRQAAEAGGQTVDLDARRRATDEMIDVFSAKLFDGISSRGLNSQVPIFVVGMPRSGTTLVEQIIASHPQAAGAGELREIERLAESLPDMPAAAGFPQCFRSADAATIRRLGDQYLETLQKRGEGKQRIVDKMWHNFFYLGFIHVVFPNARVILCRRHPLDTCLSCYFSNFRSIDWSWSLEEIGGYFCQYQRLMEHWKQVLPRQVYEVAYEGLIRDPEPSIRDLISFCGLSWNDACLEFHKHQGAVQTLSRIQVRQPIYSTSVGRWQRYDKHLSPLRRTMEGGRMSG